jgi:hypothetical protein
MKTAKRAATRVVAALFCLLVCGSRRLRQVQAIGDRSILPEVTLAGVLSLIGKIAPVSQDDSPP